MPAEETLAHRTDLGLVAAAVTDQVLATTRTVDVSDVDSWWRRIGPLLVPIVATGFRRSRTLATVYLVDHAGDNRVDLTPLPAAMELAAVANSLRITGPVAFKQHLRKTGSTDAAAAVMRDRLAASASRQALAGSRRTVARTVAEAPQILGWQRVTRPGACDFCQMLASRGAVYKSRDASITVAGRNGPGRGRRSIGESFHDHCRCVTEPLYE